MSPKEKRLTSSNLPSRIHRDLSGCLSQTPWVRRTPVRVHSDAPRPHRSIVLALALLAGAMPASPTLLARAQAQPLSQAASSQIQALLDDKAARTPAQQKIDSQLLYTRSMQSRTGVTRRVPSLRTNVRVDSQGTVLVDIKANVTSSLLQQIVAGGGQVVNSFAQFRAIRARLPLSEVELLASSPDVQFIQPAVKSELRGPAARNTTRAITPSDLFGRSFNERASRVQAALPSLLASLPRKIAASLNAGPQSSAILEQGDICERSNQARATFGVGGSGVKIGILSDSVDYLTDSQADGALGPVTVLPGQDGIVAGQSTGEGTAMLQIVHALAPGAALYFATSGDTPASFANNILALRAAGCDIIADDVGFLNESPFQDDIISQAVIQVTASGALYFSAAGNEGNLDSGAPGVWEGDFLDGGPATGLVGGRGGEVHAFPLPGGQTQPYDLIPVLGEMGDNGVDLFWDDPLGAATDDYDLFVLDPTGQFVVGSSTNVQNGTQDPYENTMAMDPDDQIVVVLVSGNGRFLHVDCGRATIQIGTQGNTRGHPCVPAAFCVAADDVNNTNPFPSPFTGGSADPVEYFSSDGPRHVFFNPDGSAITPGNFTHTGGFIRPKPDITAADGVDTTLPSFTPFYGTSAATPHAAAIAALIMSANPTLTPAQIRTTLTSTALDIMAPGYDYDSGYGIVMAYPAVQSVTGSSSIVLTSAVVGGSGVIFPGAPVNVSFALKNIGISATTNLVATLQPTGGVTSPSGPQIYGALTVGGPATSNSFTFVPTGTCGGTITATLHLQDGQNNLGTVFAILQIGQTRSVLSQNFDTVTPPVLPSGWTTTGSGTASNPNGTPWVTVTGSVDTPPNAAFVPDPADAEDDSLVSPVIPIISTSAQVSFDQSFTFNAQAPNYLDGGVLEISMAGGPWTDILAAGGSFVTGGYSQTISAAPPGAIAGRQAWAGSSIGFMTTIANLPASASGENIQLRWRMVSDGAGASTGWYVDTISVTDGTACGPTHADMSVSQSVPASAFVDSNLTDIISITNNGPDTATGITLTDALPPTFTFVSASNGGTYNQATGIVTWNPGRLLNMGILSVSLVMTPTTVQPSATNTATVSASEVDPNEANNTSTASIAVTPAVAAGFLITGLPSSIRAGVPVSVTVQAVDANGNPLPGYLGTVSFTSSDGAAILPNNYTFTAADKGAHTFNVTFTTPGSQTLTVSDVSTAVHSTVNVTILPGVGILLASSVNPSVAGQNVVFTATVAAAPPATGTPTGTVVFTDGAIVIGSGALSNEQVSISTSTLIYGSHLITAAYSGDSTFGVASATLTQIVLTPAALSLVSSADPSAPGQSVTFTSTVTSSPPSSVIPGGTVTFSDGGAILSTTPVANSQASFTTSSLSAGIHVIAASYSGDGFFGATNAPILVQLVTGKGEVFAWGNNEAGQLGNNSTTNGSSPAPVSVLSGVAAIAGGYEHSLALKGDGSVWAWGFGAYGQLGNGGYSSTSVPIPWGNVTGAVAVAAGRGHSLVLENDGTVLACGLNNQGQLGSVGANYITTPAAAGKLTGVIAIAAGDYHSLALKNDGTVWAFGSNSNGQLGNNSYTNSSIPVPVSNLTGIVALAAGEAHSIALKNDGTVWAWGSNSNGQLGSGSGTDSHIPVLVGSLSGVVSVAACGNNSLAVKQDGTAWAWGFNQYGQLGNNTTTDSSIPVRVSGISGVAMMAAGYWHSLALKSDGSVWAWGQNVYGQLGTNSTTNSAVPVPVANLTRVVAIAAGDVHSLAISPLSAPSMTLVSSANPSTYGQAATLTATVTPPALATATPTGTVTFADGSTILASKPLAPNGQATLLVSSLSAGSHALKASYSGDSNFAPASASLTQIVSAAWRAVNAASASDGTTHLLWSDGGGRADIRIIAADGSKISETTYGPFAGWQPLALAAAPDTSDHILWQDTDGTVSVWKISTAGALTYTLYGPYPGWSPVSLGVASDYSDHVLWTSTDSRMSDWRIDPSGPVTANINGPYPGWSALSIAVAPDKSDHLLWSYVDSTMATWRIAPSGSFTYATFGPYPGWAPLSIGVGPDNLDHVLWTYTDGTMSMWHLSAQGALTYALFGPYASWLPKTVSVSSDNHDNVLWVYSDGTASIWNIDPSNAFTYAIQAVPTN